MNIYYDGICKLCIGFVSLAKRFSTPGTFVFIPLQNAMIKIPENF
ncbi:MAG: DCC1-like thiol-disulfide oxidoreductase, partial [Bacteroidota bacterium]